MAEPDTWRTPEKYRDRLLRAAEKMLEANGHTGFIHGGLDFLDAADTIIDEMTERDATGAVVKGAILTKGEWLVEVDGRGTVTSLRYVRGADEPSGRQPSA